MYNYSREQSSQKCRERQLSFGAFQSARFGGQEAPKISAQQLTRRKSYANEARVAAETTRDQRRKTTPCLTSGKFPKHPKSTRHK